LTRHWGKIFQKDFEKFQIKSSSTLGRLLQSKVKKTEVKIQDSASACVIPHWGKFLYLQEARKIDFMFHTGANFSIFKKLEKFIQHYTLGQNIFHFRVENWKNWKSHLNGPRGGVSPNIC
jgi:hypothetical protein